MHEYLHQHVPHPLAYSLLAIALFVGSAFIATSLVGAAGTTYYVSSSGNNANNGTSPATAWQSISKVNSTSLNAGDAVLFEGGQTFSGSLQFDASDTGTAASPITIGSYGTGKATINSGTSRGLFAYNTAGLVVKDLNFVGAGATTNTSDGVFFYTDLPGSVKLTKVELNNLDVSGYGGRGILFGSWNGLTGYKDVRVTNILTHDNLTDGLLSYAQTKNAHENFYLGHVKSYNNLGNPSATTNTGSGIILGGVNGATVEYSEAYNNGSKSTSSGGPIGIWAYESSNILLQYNESHHNHTGGAADGGGFDFDGGVTNSIMQYNYSHDNDGAGFGLYQYSGASAWSGNTVRYNVSQNDGIKNGYGAVTFWNEGTGLADARVYGNTLYCINSAGGCVMFFSSGISTTRIMNNIMIRGSKPHVTAMNGASGIQFFGNDYAGSPFLVDWNGTSIASMTAWRSWGQERLGGVDVGYTLDPMLSAPGSGGNLGADNLSQLSAYRLKSGSPMINAGVDLATLGIAAGSHDFYGTTLPQGAFDIGAHEFLQ